MPCSQQSCRMCIVEFQVMHVRRRRGAGRVGGRQSVGRVHVLGCHVPMSACLLWGGIAAMVPATLVVISTVYGLRVLRRARTARVELALLEQGALANRKISIRH